MDKLYNEALKMLDKGLLPADISNIWILIKIVTTFILTSVLSWSFGFYLGLNSIKLLH